MPINSPDRKIRSIEDKDCRFYIETKAIMSARLQEVPGNAPLLISCKTDEVEFP